jgi:hypothetical protein
MLVRRVGILGCSPDPNGQVTIATILSDMEAEIDALEQRLGKTRAQTGDDAGTAHRADKAGLIASSD